MAERTTRTKQISLGNEIISGKKSDSRGRLVEPTAEVIPISYGIKITLDGDVGDVNFTANGNYQEATQQEDVAHFLLEVSDAASNKLIGKDEKNSKDRPVRYDEFETQLGVKLNLKNFEGKTIKLRAHLKCWLEESGWTPRGGGKETVSDEDFVDITLDVPKIKEPKQNPIISLNVVGRGLAKGEVPKDYEQQDIGKEYRVTTLLHNTTGNKLTYGELDLFENNNKITPNLPFVEMAGSVQPITVKRSQDWNWYETETDGKLTVVDKKYREFIYKLIYYLRDEYGFEFRDTIDKPLKKLKIVINIPQYKLDAVEVYNWSFDEEENAKWAELALAVALALLGVGVAWPALIIKSIIGGAAAGAGLGVGGTITTWFAGKTVNELAQELRVKLKKLIDDPPKFDKQYKTLANLKIKTVQLPKPKTKHEKVLCSMMRSKAAVSSNIEATIITSSRVWSAELKGNKAAVRKQKQAFRKYKNNLVTELEILAKHYAELSKTWRDLNIKFNLAELIAFKNAVKIRGLPHEIVIALREKGASDSTITKFKKLTLRLRTDQFDIPKAYQNYSKNLQKLAKSTMGWMI